MLIFLYFLNKHFGSGSMDKMLALSAQGPEFSSPASMGKTGHVSEGLWSLYKSMETGGVQGLAGQLV